MELTNSRMVAEFLRSRVLGTDTEELWAIALNSCCQVIDSKLLFKGTADSCLVHPRDIFRFGLFSNASSLIVGHNHPSGTPLPSFEDFKFTRDLKKAGEFLQIQVLDHVIIANDSHFSFADRVWSQAISGRRRQRKF